MIRGAVVFPIRYVFIAARLQQFIGGMRCENYEIEGL